jgi:hypothetical protein
LFAPGGDRPFGLGGFAPDETDYDVDASDREQEESGDESEIVDKVGQNCGSDPKKKKSAFSFLGFRRKGGKDLQTLDDPESTETKVLSENGKEALEQFGWPTDF